MGGMKGQRLLGIQAARGAAALLVAVYHASRMVKLPQYAGREGFGGVFAFGHAGVEFFFVLSGFIIYFVHHKDLGRAARFPRYAWRRLVRIYPSYWLVTAFALALLFAKHQSPSAEYLFTSLFLLPSPQDPIVSVAWTLVHEMLFYGVFAMAILNLRLGLAAMAIWIALIFVGRHHDLPVLAVLESARNLDFLIGIVAALIVLHVKVGRPVAVFLTGLCVFAGVGVAEDLDVLEWTGPLGSVLFGLGGGIMIVGLATAETGERIKPGRIAEFFGGTSYLLYLVHIMVIGLTYRALSSAGVFKFLPGEIVVLGAVAGTVTIAALLYRVFEKPVLAALQRFGQQHVLAARSDA